MWLMTPRGFYSAVEKYEDRKDEMITVRSRVKKDLENLPDIGVTFTPYKEDISDYPWRIRMKKTEWAQLVSIMADEINYSNFKDEVKVRQGQKRAEVYSRIWGVLLSLEERWTESRYRTGTGGQRSFGADDFGA